jgi:hypothetical protein
MSRHRKRKNGWNYEWNVNELSGIWVVELTSGKMPLLYAKVRKRERQKSYFSLGCKIADVFERNILVFNLETNETDIKCKGQ